MTTTECVREGRGAKSSYNKETSRMRDLWGKRERPFHPFGYGVQQP